MRNLVLSNLLLFLVCSCSLTHYASHQQGADFPDVKPVLWFKCDTGHFLFNTKINLFNNHYSGLMVIKCLPEDAHRVIFITAVGLKIFDIEHTTDDKLVIHYLLDPLNKKSLVRTLTNDIDLLLMNGLNGNNPEILHKKSTGEMVLKYVQNDRKYYCTFSNETGLIEQVMQNAGLMKKVRADYYGNEINGIDSVKIAHYKVKLSIEMYRIIEDHVAE